MPRCIRDRIVPPEPITALERRQVLLRLNQVIEHRLVTSDLPLQMRNLKIENGLVTFFVEHEFEAVLTLMGEGPSVPWRLLKVHVLVSDKETGEGKPLMHSGIPSPVTSSRTAGTSSRYRRSWAIRAWP